MSKVLDYFFKYQDVLYKIILVIVCTVLTVYFFPKSDRFKYDYSSGEPWQYETLLAPFDFAIEKSAEEIFNEEQKIEAQTPRYFNKDVAISIVVQSDIKEELKARSLDSVVDQSVVENFINSVYKYGYVEQVLEIKDNDPVIIKSNDLIEEVLFSNLTTASESIDLINTSILDINDTIQPVLKSLFLNSLLPDVTYDEVLTSEIVKDEQRKILPTKGFVAQNSRIIAKGEIVEGERLQILNTLNNTYESQTWTESQYFWKTLGYTVLIAMAFTMLLLFLFKYRLDIFLNNRKVTFIFFNVITIILLSTFVLKMNTAYLYVVPVCLLPLILKAFFDARLGLFSHVITVLIISFIVPFSEEYLFLQIIAGIVTILSGSEIYKRANLFITVGQIVTIYILGYFAFYTIDQGGVAGWEWSKTGYFILCGLALLFVWPLIYIYEKIFNLVSDVSLLELSDTNSKLLKELSNKAPGTFHHSLNVANIAETIANEIGANSMLVRVGALYHDVGKMKNPTYFTENQGSGINPHDDLDPEESAQIIIDHTINGIEIAKKYNLPDRVIDFIRTHHGDSSVYYFYMKAKELNESLDIENFKYPGPKPFSLETAILMIADSVEAASRSLKKPDAMSINRLVDKIIETQSANGQYLNADITFKQLEIIKAVIKKKLASIYHLRIEYPE